MANWRRYGLPYLGSFTFAQMKALTGMSDGDMVKVTNYGRGGSLWRYSASLTNWFPTAPTKVYENTALITGLQQTADQLLVAIPIEIGLLANKVFRLLTSVGKNGTTDTLGTLSMRIGPAGTTSDGQVWGVVPSMTVGQRSIGLSSFQRTASATTVEKLGGSPVASFDNFASSTLLNASTSPGLNFTTQAGYVSLTTTMSGTTDAPQLGYVALEIWP